MLNFEKIFEGLEGLEGIGKAMNDLYESIQIPIDLSTIPDDSELKASLKSILGEGGKTISAMELMKNMARFVEEINKDPKKYKSLRTAFKRELKLPTDISNWNQNTWSRIDKQLELSGINKSFTQLIEDVAKAQAGNKEVTFYDEFLYAYMNFDLVGYNSDKLDKRNTYSNLFNDSQHAFFALCSDVYITRDSTGSAKCKAIYERCGAKTLVMTPEEFLEKLKSEIKKIEIFKETGNGLKIDHLILTRIPNLDGSDFDYKIEYVDFSDGKKTLVGTCDLILGYISFVETKGIGIPSGAMKLLSTWIEENMEK